MSLEESISSQAQIQSLLSQVKKRWEDITGNVKRKERNARNQELKRLGTTGNGYLADEVRVMSVRVCSISKSGGVIVAKVKR